jgi:hypothetical protein
MLVIRMHRLLLIRKLRLAVDRSTRRGAQVKHNSLKDDPQTSYLESRYQNKAAENTLTQSY